MLYHPDGFALEPGGHRVVDAVVLGTDSGSPARHPPLVPSASSAVPSTAWKIANYPHGYILRQGWASLDFRDEEQVSRLRKLWESLELEILSVLEATKGRRTVEHAC